jgi:hypothetical protein
MCRLSPRACFLLLAFTPCFAYSQSPAATLPAGTPLAVALDRNCPMRAGASIQGHLLYPIYVDSRVVLPQGTKITGVVESLGRDRSRRTNAILGGDFTPFRIPRVRFTGILLADGSSLPIVTAPASSGAPLYRAVAPPPAKGGFLRQQIDAGLDAARGDLAYFIAPGKGDRLLQWVYSQLPYHPQRIEKGTAWTVELAGPVDIPAQPAIPVNSAPPPRRMHFWEVRSLAPERPRAGTWRIEANLAEGISSETSARGQTIHAVVAEPVRNSNGSIAVPQGALLNGSVTRVRPAHWLGRSGVLTFSFNQLTLPDQETQVVQTRLTEADSAQGIALNSEGEAKSRPRDRVAIPLILAVMASSPLDQDNGHFHHAARKNGTAGAAGLGLVGTVVAAAGGSPSFATGIGYWGAARSVFGRWIARGQKITFPKDTRIVVETVPRRAQPIRPDPAREP